MYKYFTINNRPISPHLLIYIPQLSSLFSIWHRITGIFLSSFIAWYLLFLKIVTVIKFSQLNIWTNFLLINQPIIEFNKYLYIITFIIFYYHMLNGIRHIMWDIGFLLNKHTLFFSSIILLVILFIFILKTLFQELI